MSGSTTSTSCVRAAAVKGIGLAGAYAALEAYGFQPQNLAGTPPAHPHIGSPAPLARALTRWA
jgi:hypothetical protein